MKGARQAGESRVVDGVEACKQRNEIVRKTWLDDEKLLDAAEPLLNEPFPFKGKPEI